MNIRDRIAQSAQGDKGAFQEIFEHLNDELFRYAVSRVATREDALDVVQQTFIDLWKQLPQFRYSSDQEFYGFVYLVLKRHIGKTYRHKHISLDDMEYEALYEMDVAVKSDLELVMRVMESLKESYQDVLRLRHWEGLSFREIADRRGGTEASVRVTHHRALELLKEKTQRYI